MPCRCFDPRLLFWKAGILPLKSLCGHGERGLRARGTRPLISVELFRREALGPSKPGFSPGSNLPTHYMPMSLREEMLKSGHATNFKKQMTTAQSPGTESRKVSRSWVTRSKPVAGKQEEAEPQSKGKQAVGEG